MIVIRLLNQKNKIMKEFLFLFRADAAIEKKWSDTTSEIKPSPDEMQAMMKAWENWMGGIAAQNKLASRGNRLGFEGRTVKPGNVVTNGPYAELKEVLGGYIVIRSTTIDEAAEIAKGCPLIIGGVGSVEVRDLVPMNN